MNDAPDIAYRPAREPDAERIAALLTDEGFPAGTSDIVSRLERFGPPGGAVIVAVSGDDILGFVALQVVPRFEHADRFVRILALVVDPGVRGRGLGRGLVGEAERIGREHGASFAEITAGHHRPDARRLYEALGYDAAVTAYLRKRF